LRAADTALANGNSTEALHQLTLSQLQVLMLGMKTMGTVDMAQTKPCNFSKVLEV
jgi:hypothetical protein